MFMGGVAPTGYRALAGRIQARRPVYNNICFVAGTPVVVGVDQSAGTASNIALAATDDNRFNTYYTLSAGALLAAGWMAAEAHEEKKRRKQTQLHAAAERVFDHLDDDPDPPDPDRVDEDPADDLYLTLAARDRFDDARLQAAADAYCQEVGTGRRTVPQPAPRALRRCHGASARGSQSALVSTQPAQRATQTETPTVAANSETQPVTSDRSHDAAHYRRPTRSLLRSTAITFLLALSAFFGLKGYLGSTPARLPQPQLTAASAPAPALDTIPIEQIRVGQRVLTGAAEPDKTLPTAVDPRTWRHLTLEETDTWPPAFSPALCAVASSDQRKRSTAMERKLQVAGGPAARICVESLMPPDWLALHNGAPVGSRVPIPLDLEEMGLPEGMTARVTANEPGPAIDRGPGRVVLTTVNHLNPRVVELTLQVGTGGPTVPEPGNDSTAGKNRSRSRSAIGDLPAETLRPTALHKFYSETRGEWLSAEDLQPGEILRGLTGPLEVVSQRPIPGTHRVYNMTVEGEHVYHVSTLGVLAHNMMCAGAPRTSVATEAHDAANYARYKAELARLEAMSPADPMRGTVILRRPAAGATAAQDAQIREYMSVVNLSELEGYMSPTGRVSTSGALRAAADRAASAERARAAVEGTPYRWVVGHGPDTTWTGHANAPFWVDLERSINSSLGRQAQDYPLGYRPSRFIFEGDY